MDNMKKLTVWQCKWCKKLFRTPNRHYCKFNPELKNCFSCKHLKGWIEHEPYPPWDPPSNSPDCNLDLGYSWDIGIIKDCKYNMQCEGWEHGKFDWLEYAKRKDISERGVMQCFPI